MGCFWSSEPREHYMYNKEHAVVSSHKRVRASSTQEISHRKSHVTQGLRPISHRKPLSAIPSKPQPLYGEYKCPACGRAWSSRLCWPNRYQNCNRCKKPVYSHIQREVRLSDIKDSKLNQEHKKELCQMCQQLGYYCGNFGKKDSRQRKLTY